ncbi:MAG: FecR domain-containing protein, partial [Polyangiales bacterium]
MAEPRAHEPKLAALEAYERRLLSATACGRLEAHLGSCAACREALVGMRRFARIKDDVLAAEAPSVDWARMELPLRREAARLARRHRVQRVAPAIGLAVAAAVALFFVERTKPPESEHARRSAPSSEVARPVVAPLSAQITALIGEVHGKDPRGVDHSLELDTTLAEGWLLETGPDAELHLALEDTAALIVAPGSRLWLRALRSDSVVLELEQGRVINHVRKRSQGQRYEISSAERRVAVRGTRFSVERMGAALAVQVDEGAVVVLDAAGSTVTELAAPARWSEGGVQQRSTALARPREAAPGIVRSALFEAPTWPRVAQWQIDGADLEAHGALQMRLPPGDVEIGALLEDG